MFGMNKSMRKITYYENILEFKENTKEELNLNEINNWKLCRTCLVDTDENDVDIKNMSIMDAMRGTILNIHEMLVEITRIKVTIDNKLDSLSALWVLTYVQFEFSFSFPKLRTCPCKCAMSALAK